MFSLAALTALLIGAGIAPTHPIIALLLIALGLALAYRASLAPGDLEWLLGVLAVLGIAGSVVEFGAYFGLWST